MSSKWHGGKGDARRTGADDESYKSGWERIFGSKKEKDDDTKK